MVHKGLSAQQGAKFTVALFSKRKAAEAEEQERLQDQDRKDHREAIIGRINVWLEHLESERAPGSDELSAELLGRVGGPPMPIAANAQEANHSLFISEYSMVRSFAQNMANRRSAPLTLQIRDAQAAGDEEAVARLKHLASFWSSVEHYCSRL